MIVDPDSDDNAVGPYDVGYSDGSPRMQLCKDFYPDLELKPSTATYTFDGVRDRGTCYKSLTFFIFLVDESESHI